MDKPIDFLESEYGIKENQHYSIFFKLEQSRETIQVKGEILNFILLK
jgi:hypothetical protein